jgi:ABC-2 type transport system ATP-binding protein
MPGRILGFLGPNGAGKTTSIRILTTMMEPDKGHFVVAGISSEYPDKIRKIIGVLPENLGFPRQITGIEYLTYFGQLYGRTKVEAKAYGMKLLEEVGLYQRAKSLVGSYSHGMRQRLGIARALVNDPFVVFLDEPTLGLDPRGQQDLLSIIQRIVRERKVGVVLCSHALGEVETVCDDVIILRSGRVIASGSVADVIEKVQQNVIRIHVPSSLVNKTKKVIKSLPGVLKVNHSEKSSGWLEIELLDLAAVSLAEKRINNNKILEALITAGIPVLTFEAEGGRLQDVFLRLTEEALQ